MSDDEVFTVAVEEVRPDGVCWKLYARSWVLDGDEYGPVPPDVCMGFSDRIDLAMHMTAEEALSLAQFCWRKRSPSTAAVYMMRLER